MILVGYSGHGYVAIDIFQSMNIQVSSYCEITEKASNPYQLKYLGSELEPENIIHLREEGYFLALGSNKLREKVYKLLTAQIPPPANAIHTSATIANKVQLSHGVMVAANVAINPLAKIGEGVICNTGCIIEHECQIDDFAHIAPGATLAGNVTVGKRTFVGANSSVKQGVTIGDDVTIGAGSVIIRDIPDGVTVVGNPGRIISK